MRILTLSLVVVAAAAEPRRSVMVLPVEWDLSVFLVEAERELPGRMASPWEQLGQRIPMPVAYRYDLERSALEVEGAGVGKAVIRTRVRYSVDVGVAAPNLREGVAWKRVSGCRPSRPVTMRLETSVDFGADWSVVARTVPRLEMPEACRLMAGRTPVQVDISEKVRLAFADGLNRAAAELDRRIRERARLRAVAEAAWSRLSSPVVLGGGLVLRLNPVSVGVLRPVMVGRVIRTGVRVEGVPQLGEEGSAAVPLPALQWADGGGEFVLDWESAMGWGEAEERLREAVVGKTVRVAGRRTVLIEGARLMPKGEWVAVTVDVSGGVKGRITLEGRPVLNEAAGRMEFADLRFDLETNNFLIRVADWFRHEGTRKKLEEMARVDLLALMNGQRSRLEAALREHFGEGMRLRGGFEALGPMGWEMNESGIRVRMGLRGALTLVLAGGRL